MFRKFVSAFVASAMLLTSSVPAGAAMTGDGGQFFYRYKSPVSYDGSLPEVPVGKDVTAFYIGGVGYAFNERLPMKPEWQDDEWRITSGALPRGLQFDAESLTFVGTPEELASGRVVELEGYDTTNTKVATATATFDVVTVMGQPATVNFYAHTGKYKLDTLPIPEGLTVDKWVRNTPPPEGMAINGPYFEGVPTKAGDYPVHIIGLNYMGEVIITFVGKYVVEDGPTFPPIADMVRELRWSQSYGWANRFSFGAPSTHKVNHQIRTDRAPRYYVEIDSDADGAPDNMGALPEPVVSNENSLNLVLEGWIRTPYNTAVIRYKAIDSDNTVGYSNWFEFGTSDPIPACAPNYSGYPLVAVTGRENTIRIPKPVTIGEVLFSISEGTVPDDLVLDPQTGVLSGVPRTAGERHAFKVKVDVTNDGKTVSTYCSYRMDTWAGNLSFADATPRQERHIRAGDVYNGVLSVKNGQEDYTVTFGDEAAWPTLGFTTPNVNTAEVGVSGVVSTPGTRSVPFNLANGDTSEQATRLTIYSHGELAVGEVPTITVKRLAASRNWGSVPYDASTVIPDASGRVDYPRFVVDHPLGLPADIAFDADGSFTGATAAEAKSYGPFVATMSDFSGDSVVSNSFNVVVEPRDEIAVEKLTPPVFTVEWDRDQSATPLIVKQPPLAEKFRVDYTLNGPALPSWMTFDQTSGSFTAATGVPHAAIGEYGPYTITATDEEGSTVTTEPFSVTLRDWPTPSGSVPPVSGSVSGDPKAGETLTWISVSSLRDHIDENTVIGGRAGVTFLSAEPASPAGLVVDISDGSISGEPTSEFDGTVLVKFKDIRGREGALSVPLKVKPYPAVSMTAADYSLARLSAAHLEDIPMRGEQVRGFWNDPSWSWAEDVNPSDVEGLYVSRVSGQVNGNTLKPEGTVLSGLRLKAVSIGAKGEELVSYTDPFSLTVAALRPISVVYRPGALTYYLTELPAGGYALSRKADVVADVHGSHTAPVTYSMDTKGVPELAGLSINYETGGISGYPSAPGEWPVEVSARDAEGRTTATPAILTIKSTLDGDVQVDMPEDANGDGYGNGPVRLRVGQTFTTTGIDYSQAVGNVVFGSVPAFLPSGFQFDSLSGRFHGQPAETAVGQHRFEVHGQDRDGRQLSQVVGYDFEVVGPLGIQQTASAPEARQFSEDEPVSVQFPEPWNVIGDISYSLAGDLPGTLVNMTYDDSGNFTGWSWKDESADMGLPATASVDQLPLGALVFDPASRVLTGIPSEEGTFTVTMTARDNHAAVYNDLSDPTRLSSNRASSTATLVVRPAAALEVVNEVGGQPANTETLPQFTSQARLAATAKNAAYGKPVTWTAVSSNLPDGVSPSRNALNVTYPGYPEALGTFGPNAWRATDVMGRTAIGPAATFTVGPRLPLELVSADPIGLVVNTTTADEMVTAKNAAYGTVIPGADWSVTGLENLPPGISYEIMDGGVKFTGTATQMGVFSGISVSAVDSLGARASKTLTFVILAPEDPIGLEVQNIVTKVGFPFAMQAVASNTYGTPRFYSYDIAAELRDQLVIHEFSGLVDGRLDKVMDLDFDIYVTDGSDRVTSRPVLVSVLPDLRVTVPQIVAFEPFKTQTQSVATDYVVGKVSYEKANPADWPEGVTLDPNTGAIISDGTLGIGEYAGLQIRATDTFPGGQTDTQLSNEFTIRVEANGAYFELVGGQIDPWEKRLAGYTFDLRREPYLLNMSGMGETDISWSTAAQPNGHVVPVGLTINDQGIINGTPRVTGDFTFTVTATLKGDSRVKRTAVYTMSITLQATELELLDTADGAITPAEANMPYSFDFKDVLKSRNIPHASLVWSLTHMDGSNAPTGLSIYNGVLSGTPQGADWYDIKVRTYFNDSYEAKEYLNTEKVYRIFIKKRPTVIGGISDRTLSTRQTFDVTPSASYKHPEDVYSIVGDFPDGLFYDGHTLAPDERHYGFEFDTKTGRIYGSTRVSGVFPITIKVTDKYGQETRTTFALTLVDDTPTSLGEFVPQTGVEKFTDIYSNTILVSGNRSPANTVLEAPSGTFVRRCASPLEAQQGMCTGASYGPGVKFTIGSGTYIQIVAKTPNAYDTELVAKVTVGGVERTFTARTRTSVAVPVSLSEFVSIDGAEPRENYSSNAIKFEGLTDSATVVLSKVEGSTTATAYVCNNASGSAGQCQTVAGVAISAQTTVTVPKDGWLLLRIQASPVFGAATKVRAEVGDLTREFSVRTRQSIAVPASLGEFVSIDAAEPRESYSSNALKFEGLTEYATVVLSKVEGSTTATAYVCNNASGSAGQCQTTGSAYSISAQSTVVVPKDGWLLIQVQASAVFGAATRVRAEVGGLAREFSVRTRQSDEPSVFATDFRAVSGVEKNALIYSNTIRIDGVTGATTASLEPVGEATGVSASLYVCSNISQGTKGSCYNNGYYRIGVAPGGSATVWPGEYLQLRLRSADAFSTATSVRVTVGGVAKTFTVTTRDSNTVPVNLGEFGPASGVEKNATAFSNTVRVDGITDVTTATLEAVGDTAGISANLYVCNGTSPGTRGECYISGSYRTQATLGVPVAVSPGEYLQLRLRAADAFSTATSVRVTVGGVARTFTVTTRDSNTVPVSLGEFVPAVADPSGDSYSNVIKFDGLTENATVTFEGVDGASNATLYVCKPAYPSGCASSSSYYARTATIGTSVAVEPGYGIQLRARSAATYSTPVSVRIRVGELERVWTVTTRAPDYTPERLGQFNPVGAAPKNAYLWSNGLRLEDMADTATVSVELGTGTYARAYVCTADVSSVGACSGSYVQAPGSSALGVPGRYLFLYVRSAADPNTEVRARVNVGGVVREWSVTTGP